MPIRPLKEYTEEAFVQIAKLQRGERVLPKTGYDFIDNHLGCMLPGDVALISSPSGTGKTTIAQGIKKNILNKEINPEADEYVYVDYSLEMKVFNLLMRASAEILNKKKSEILFNEFTEEEKAKIREYNDTLQDDRQFIDQLPPTPLEFYNDVKAFAEKHADKKGIFICFDHVLLAKGADKKKMLEQLCEQINQLKLEIPNIYFLLVSQSNRDIYKRIAEKNNLAAPMALDVFGSSFLDQLCSFNIFLYNPYRAGIREYMKINPDRYDYLSEHFTTEDSKGRVSFKTEGLIFAHCIKTRESDNIYKDIYVIDMGLSEEQKKELREEREPSKTDDGPIFVPETVQPEVEAPVPMLSPEEAFGGPADPGFTSDDIPF